MEDKILASLEGALHQLPAPSFKAIASAPITKMTQHDSITRQQPTAKILPLFLKVMPLAAVFILALFVWVNQFVLVDSVIQLDINPSLEFSLNKREQVVAVVGLSPDGSRFLQGKEYERKSLPEAVDALMNDLSVAGYLKEEAATILVSAQGKDPEKTTLLTKHVSDRLALAAVDSNVSPRLYTQHLDRSPEEKLLAQEQEISQGKMQLINHLISQEPSLVTKELATLSIQELVALAKDLNLKTGLKRPIYKSLGINVDPPAPPVKAEGSVDSKPVEGITPPPEAPEPQAGLDIPAATPPPADTKPPLTPKADLTPPLPEPVAEPEPSAPISPPPEITPRPEGANQPSGTASATTSATASATASVTASATD